MTTVSVAALIFDLDNTLYPPETGLFPAIDRRIDLFLRERLGLTPGQARDLRARYRRTYHVTLRGLMAEHGIRPEEYLDFVHRVPVEELVAPDPELDALLGGVPCPAYVFTNGSHRHAQRVLSRLGVEHRFAGIFDIASVGYVPKPEPTAFRRVLEAIGRHPRETVYVDDLPANLEAAARLGITTILLGPPGAAAGGPHRAAGDLAEAFRILGTFSFRS